MNADIKVNHYRFASHNQLYHTNNVRDVWKWPNVWLLDNAYIERVVNDNEISWLVIKRYWRLLTTSIYFVASNKNKLEFKTSGGLGGIGVRIDLAFIMCARYNVCDVMFLRK